MMDWDDFASLRVDIFRAFGEGSEVDSLIFRLALSVFVAVLLVFVRCLSVDA